MRLIDDIHNLHWDSVPVEQQEVFSRAQHIVCDDVTEYYFALNAKERWDVPDFPNVAPPFQTFWIETRHPSKIFSEDFGTTEWNDASRPSRWGVLFDIVSKDHLLENVMGGQTIYTLDDLLLLKWAVRAVLYLDSPTHGIHSSWVWVMPILPDGGLWTKYDLPLNESVSGFSYSIRPNVVSLLHRGAEGARAYRAHRASAHALFHPMLLTLTFLHCKNVGIRTVRPDKALARKHARSGRVVHTYKTLEIKPITKMLEAARAPGESGIQQALSRCRGHFKTYTEAAPLLGHAVGTYFWSDQLRGSVKRGTRSKSYKVKP
jgi:hypothetical protein